MPILDGEVDTAPRARARGRYSRWSKYVLPITVLVSLFLLFNIPRSGHVVDELSIDVPSSRLEDVALGDHDLAQQPFRVPDPLTSAIKSTDDQYLPTDQVHTARPQKGSAELALAQVRPKRVAIIGVPEGQLLGDVVVVDKEGYVGGRKLFCREIRRSDRA
jgi:hypothetical protein